MTVQNVIILLEFCFNNVYLLFQDKFYEQREGIAVGSPVHPIVASLIMEDFEIRVIKTAENPPGIWRGYKDETYVIQKETQEVLP